MASSIPQFEDVMRQRRKKECEGKARYPLHRDAHKEAVAMNTKHAPQRFKAYACPFCGRWHVGHTRMERG